MVGRSKRLLFRQVVPLRSITLLIQMYHFTCGLPRNHINNLKAHFANKHVKVGTIAMIMVEGIIAQAYCTEQTPVENP